MLLLGDPDVADERQLDQLALGHLPRRLGERVEDLQVALLERGLEGRHVEPVAHQHRRLVAPLGRDGLPPAPHLGAVDDVVVDQRRRVEELHDGRHADHRLVRLLAEDFGGEHQQGRADTLAPGLAQVAPDVRDDLNIRAACRSNSSSTSASSRRMRPKISPLLSRATPREADAETIFGIAIASGRLSALS